MNDSCATSSLAPPVTVPSGGPGPAAAECL
jgi:hypothetical protein